MRMPIQEPGAACQAGCRIERWCGLLMYVCRRRKVGLEHTQCTYTRLLPA